MPELAVIFASLLFIWEWWHTDAFQIQKLPPMIAVALAMICIGLISSSLWTELTSVQLGIIKSWFFFPILFAWLVFQQSPSFKKHALFAWYAILVVVAFVAIFSFLNGNLTYDGRLKAWYLSPNHLALFLFPGVFLGWHFITENIDKTKKRVLLASWVVLCVTLFFTLSYTVILASLFTFFGLLFVQYKHSFHSNIRIIRIALCGFFLIAFFLFQVSSQKFFDILSFSERSSMASRVMIWQASEKMLLTHPFLGIGPGNFQDTYLEYQKYFPPYLEWAVPQPHNLYLAFWLYTGIIGLFGFMALLFFFIQHLLVIIKDTKKTPVAQVFLGILLTLLIIGLFDTPVWKTDLAYSFWLLIALGLRE